MEYTSNYNLAKPSNDDHVRIEVLNENFDKLDTAIKGVQTKAEAIIADFDNPKEWTKDAAWAGGAEWVWCEWLTEKLADDRYHERIIAHLHNTSGKEVTANMMLRATSIYPDMIKESYYTYDYMDKIVDGVMTEAPSRNLEYVLVTATKTDTGYQEKIEYKSSR